LLAALFFFQGGFENRMIAISPLSSSDLLPGSLKEKPNQQGGNNSFDLRGIERDLSYPLNTTFYSQQK